MERQHRISAGGIVIHQNKLLLVRYSPQNYLVAPGGGVIDNEGTNQALVREVREETGIEVAAHGNRILFVEDFTSSRYRHIKIWFLCDVIGGLLADTEGAREEGISEAGWYSRDQLKNEVVYPAPLLSHDWNEFFKDNRDTIYLENHTADF